MGVQRGLRFSIVVNQVRDCYNLIWSGLTFVFSGAFLAHHFLPLILFSSLWPSIKRLLLKLSAVTIISLLLH